MNFPVLKSAVGAPHVSPARKGWVKKDRSDNREHRRCGTKSLLFPPSFPILIGEGIPLTQPRHRSTRLKLLSAKAYPDGIARLLYRTTPPC